MGGAQATGGCYGYFVATIDPSPVRTVPRASQPSMFVTEAVARAQDHLKGSLKEPTKPDNAGSSSGGTSTVGVSWARSLLEAKEGT